MSATAIYFRVLFFATWVPEFTLIRQLTCCQDDKNSDTGLLCYSFVSK
jgi:hypothetical protein